ncbi:unnamed protein product [Prorocentrum cordatum]|uniref:Uncharacterized protein n=1 Tax=Prorocentrum cordatum TaxID=2364126 RepID=A0ABN9TK26_9DINO|nr:unnamed protein product [Polarella glacialis]
MGDAAPQWMIQLLSQQKDELLKAVKPEAQIIEAVFENRMSEQDKNIKELADKIKEQGQKITILEQRRPMASSQASTFAAPSRISNDDGTKSRRTDVATNPCVKFVGTFPRPLLQRTRQEHFETLKAQFDELTDDVEVTYDTVNQNYRITFKSPLVANKSQQLANQAGIFWSGPRDQKQYPRRVRGDMPLEVRREKSAVAALWPLIYGKISIQPSWSSAHRLGVNGHKGVLQVTADDVWELVKAVPMGTDTFHFQAEQANLTRRGISSSETTNIFKLAQATVPEESNFSWQALQLNNISFENKMSEQDKNIKELADKVKEQGQKITILEQRRPMASSQASTFSVPSRISNDDGAKRRRTDVATNPCVKFVGTFPRPLLQRTRQEHFESLKAQFDELTDDVEVTYDTVNQNYNITFKSPLVANKFQQLANQAGIFWGDPRDQKQYPLRVRGDMPLEVRREKSAVAALWQLMHEKISIQPSWSSARRLGVNGHEGVLQVTADDAWESVKAVPMGIDAFHFQAEQANLTRRGISSSDATNISKLAQVTARDARLNDISVEIASIHVDPSLPESTIRGHFATLKRALGRKCDNGFKLLVILTITSSFIGASRSGRGKKPGCPGASQRAFSSSPYCVSTAGQASRPGPKCSFGIRSKAGPGGAGGGLAGGPGPGAHCVDSLVEDRLARFRPAPKFSFGTAARLADVAPKTVPGPTDYSVLEASGPWSSRGPAVSMTPRRSEPARGGRFEKSPGPGSHDLPALAGASPRITINMSPRTDPARAQTAPGPGHYGGGGAPLGDVDRRKETVYGSSPRCTFGTAPRRSPARPRKAPGPGAYRLASKPHGPQWSMRPATVPVRLQQGHSRCSEAEFTQPSAELAEPP